MTNISENVDCSGRKKECGFWSKTPHWEEEEYGLSGQLDPKS